MQAHDDKQELTEAGYWPAIAEGYMKAGEYARAAELCQRMLEMEPNVISGRCVLGKALYHAGQLAEARTQFVEVLKRDPANLLALKFLGDILCRDGEEAAAMTYYRRILEIDPHTRGLACSTTKPELETTRQVTLKRGSETVPAKEAGPLREPAFVTETIGDIYRDQGYFRLAHEVYRRLLARADNSRIAAKLRETEKKLNKKEGHHEASNR